MHLADGATYTYIRGDEYEDSFAAWDWDHIPGTTIDYENTPLTCQNTALLGIESFVGGISSQDGTIGLSAMRFTNPITQTFSWQKAWFFLDGVQHVMVSNISSASTAPVHSVLDQRLSRGEVFIDGVSTSSGSTYQGCNTLWHGDVGYTFGDNSNVTLTVQLEQKTGDWSTIGTSTQPPVSVNMFTAYIEHDQDMLSAPVEYSVFPGMDQKTFARESMSRRVKTVQNDAHVSAVFDDSCGTFLGVFWDEAGGGTMYAQGGSAPVMVAVDANVAVIYKEDSGEVTVSDPSQTLATVSVTVTRGDKSQVLAFQLPSGGMAGSGVTQYLQSSRSWRWIY